MVIDELEVKNGGEQNPLIRAVVRFEDGKERSVVGRPLGKMTLSTDDGITTAVSFPIEAPDPFRLNHGLLISESEVAEFIIEGFPSENGIVPMSIRPRPDIAVINFQKIW